MLEHGYHVLINREQLNQSNVELHNVVREIDTQLKLAGGECIFNKNAMIPVITLIGLDLGALMGGAVLTETIFNWPGVGRVIYLAVLKRDAPVVLGGTLVLVLVFILLNLIIDIFYAWLDPRIRYHGKETNI